MSDYRANAALWFVVLWVIASPWAVLIALSLFVCFRLVRRAYR